MCELCSISITFGLLLVLFLFVSLGRKGSPVHSLKTFFKEWGDGWGGELRNGVIKRLMVLSSLTT